MKIQNTWTRSYLIDGQWISPGEKITVSEDCGWETFVDSGKAKAFQTKIKEKVK